MSALITQVFEPSDDPCELHNLAADRAAATEFETELEIQFKEMKYQVPPNAVKRR